jgi:hypothetical protein
LTHVVLDDRQIEVVLVPMGAEENIRRPGGVVEGGRHDPLQAPHHLGVVGEVGIEEDGGAPVRLEEVAGLAEPDAGDGAGIGCLVGESGVPVGLWH